jgi:hypothetical protein
MSNKAVGIMAAAILVCFGLYLWQRPSSSAASAKLDPSPNDALRSASYAASGQSQLEAAPTAASSLIVRKTFPVTHTIEFAFDVPPHTVMPHFHGTFQSFTRDSGASSHDNTANVDLLLMNEEQYSDFAAGRESDVLLVADSSNYSDLTFDLPPSVDRPAHYHLVFRNTPGAAAKKIVHADFSVDF